MGNIRILQSVAANYYCPDHGGIESMLRRGFSKNQFQQPVRSKELGLPSYYTASAGPRRFQNARVLAASHAARAQPASPTRHSLVGGARESVQCYYERDHGHGEHQTGEGHDRPVCTRAVKHVLGETALDLDRAEQSQYTDRGVIDHPGLALWRNWLHHPNRSLLSLENAGRSCRHAPLPETVLSQIDKPARYASLRVAIRQRSVTEPRPQPSDSDQTQEPTSQRVLRTEHVRFT